MSRKSFLLLSFVLSVAMIAPAQQGGGGGGREGGGTTGGNTGGGDRGGQGGTQGGRGGQQNDPFGQQNDPFGQQRQQQNRPIFLSGQVLQMSLFIRTESSGSFFGTAVVNGCPGLDRREAPVSLMLN